MHSWFADRRCKTGGPGAKRTCQPMLEVLHDRLTPAAFNVTTTLDVIDPADGKRSLREAVAAANNLPGADVIVLPAGVYNLALAGAGEDANATGDLDITGAVTIRGAGAGASIVDGQQLDRVFDVIGTAPSSIKVVLEKLTVRNGNATGDGGGIQVANANLATRDSAVVGNRASLTGGGIAGLVGSPTVNLVRATVARNVVEFDGGGVHAITAKLTNCTVRRNAVNQGLGGGVLASTATLTGCTVSGNSAGNSGGGIEATTLNLSNTTVRGNIAQSGSGGGIFADTATLTSCTVSGNSAGNSGGGVIASNTNLTNSTVSGNTTDGHGGGIRANTANLTNSTVSGNSSVLTGGGIIALTANLTNSTVSGNSAGNGGGIRAEAGTLLNCSITENLAQGGGGLLNTSGTFNVRNTIVALNLVKFGGSSPDISGAFTSQGHNIIGDGTGGAGFSNGVNGDVVGTSANPIDPKLGPLANNGGKIKTHALLAGSPAIDRGDNTNLPPTDQRGAGFARKKDGNGDGVAIVDIGAFER